MSSTTTHDTDASMSDNSALADELLWEARIPELVEAIEAAEDPPTTREVAEEARMPVGTAKKMLPREDEFFIAYAERIRGASYRHYWGVKAEENEDRL